jgi:branched-chain amino acid transport system permease protein
MIFGVTRVFHFAHGGIYLIGGYLSFVFYSVLSFPIVLAVICAMVISSVIGLAIDIFVYRPLRRISASPLVIMMSSMGLFIVIQNILAICFGYESLQIHTQFYGKSIQLKAISITYLDIITILATLLVIVSLVFFLKYTFVGKSIRAAKDNILLAEVIGVNINLVYLVAFGLGSGIVALAASLNSMDIGVNPTLGFNVVLIGAIAVTIGGLGSLPGAVLGAFVISLAENIGVWKLSSAWQNTIAFGLFFVFIILLPKGFFGEKLESGEI